jgi:predicted TIM-barrel fold metal-dependent hydrolase
MMRTARVDVNTFVGPYPFRHVPHPEPGALVAVMAREGISSALVGYLPAPWHRSVSDANDELFRLLAAHADVLIPVPAINAAWPAWERELSRAVDSGAAAVRAYPPQWGDSAGRWAAELTIACAEKNLPVILTTRFEDSRQRHWMDNCGDVSASVVRTMARSHTRARVILTCAGRDLIEEIHWSLTPGERARVWYDISWIWGPPQHDLAHLFASVGAERFLFGSMWPMRLVQTPFANLELLPRDFGEGGPALADPRQVVPLLAGAP